MGEKWEKVLETREVKNYAIETFDLHTGASKGCIEP